MEKHIFKFGNSSLAFIVPKKWTDKNKILPSSIIQVNETEHGELLISAEQNKKDRKIVAINSKLDPDIVARWAGLHYMYGISNVAFKSSDTITKKQVEAVENEIQIECPGFEIVNQSSSEIQIEDFTDIREVDIEKVVARLRSLLDQEFIELKNGNKDTVERLEQLVDRFYMLGFRYVSIKQPKNMLKYYRIIQLMEMMSDTIYLISRDTNLSKGTEVIIDMLKEQSKASENAVKGDRKAIIKITILRKEIREAFGKMRISDIQKKLFREMTSYSCQIGEFGLLESDNIFIN